MSGRDAVFRHRGVAMTRVETFTDAAFAFALTLLVISLEPPTDMTGFATALSQVPAFLLSATMLMMFWWGHHEWSRRFGLDDMRTFLLSCMLVFTVLVYVYPLRFMFGAMMSWIGGITGLPLGSGVSLSGPSDLSTIFMVYGLGFTAMSVAILLLNIHAWRLRDTLQLDSIEQHETRTTIGVWAIHVATGTLSTLVALLHSGHPAWSAWVYATLPVTMSTLGVVRARSLARLTAQQHGAADPRHAGLATAAQQDAVRVQ